MNGTLWQIAQINVGRLRVEPPHPMITEFMDNLDRINALAESSPGFVWRLKDDSNNATSIRAFDDPRIAVNMSVWETVEALQAYAYRSEHVQFFRRRKEWFEAFGMPHLALWWVKAGTIPTVKEAKARLLHLHAHGPTAQAFTFRERFESA
jgi:hypothetical protein